ncbi:MAG TPA: hypothetical protein VN822_05895 [Candidatus Acidoferrales bacterium]|nr:hypothetical protein [Candidatus Acidoferrales bacterium]
MTRRTLEIAAFSAALLFAALAIHAWLASRDEQMRLAATLSAQKQLIDAADSRERSRQTTLDVTLAQIDKLKRAAQTPAQIVRDLPKYLPLPQPITLSTVGASVTAQTEKGIALPETSATNRVAQGASPEALSSGGRTFRSNIEGPRGVPSSAQNLSQQVLAPQSCSPPSDCSAQIPAADLKPLYDFVQDCRACQAQLAAARQDKSDDGAKIAALTRERDAAITAAKGGSFWRRLRRNTMWFVVGAGFGAAGGYAAKH